MRGGPVKSSCMVLFIYLTVFFELDFNTFWVTYNYNALIMMDYILFLVVYEVMLLYTIILISYELFILIPYELRDHYKLLKLILS